jgi:hypothetical protein
LRVPRFRSHRHKPNPPSKYKAKTLAFGFELQRFFIFSSTKLKAQYFEDELPKYNTYPKKALHISTSMTVMH